MEVVCQNCQIKFHVKPSQVKKGEGKFCSKSCYNLFRQKREIAKCNFCEKEFLIRTRYVKLGRAKHCSRFCSSQSKIREFSINLICVNCQQTFSTPRNRAEKGRKFCSQLCLEEFNESQKSEVNCFACGKPLIRVPNRKLDKNFCSRDCVKIGKQKGEFVKCKNCEKETWRRPSLLNKNKNIFCSRLCQHSFYKGENHSKWKGGVTPEDKKIRHSDEYKKWRREVFKRDVWTCQNCGDKSRKGNPLKVEAHHIKSFKNFPELRFDINNGVTLCPACHKETDNYGTKCNRSDIL